MYEVRRDFRIITSTVIVPTPVTAPPSAATAWDPANKDSNNTLSGSDLITTGTAAAYSGGRTVKTLTNGKWYWEMVVTTLVTGGGNNTAGGFGCDVSGTGPASYVNYLGSSAQTIGWAQDGTVYTQGFSGGTAVSYAAGDRLCFAVDVPNLKMYFRKAGGAWHNTGDPPGNTGGTSIAYMSTGTIFYPMYMCGNSSGDVYTATFSAASWVHTAPTGYIEITA